MDIKKSFDILKVDDDKRIVYGWGSVAKQNGEDVIDGEKDVVTLDELEKAASVFVMNSRVGCASHLIKGVATLTTSIVFTPEIQKAILPDGVKLDKEGWFVGFYVQDDDVWDMVKSGEIGSFSIGGTAERVEL